jgi:hypothetical protein
VQPTDPQSVLERDLARCRALQIEQHLKRDCLQAFANLGRGRTPGWIITSHFFDLGPWLAPVWGSPSQLWKAARCLLGRLDSILCTREMIKAAARYWGPRIYSPGCYLAILQLMRLPTGSRILDLFPGLGHRALACGILGHRYVVPKQGASAQFEGAVTRGFADWLGLDWCYDDDKSIYDLVIADNSFLSAAGRPVLRSYGDRARRLLLFTPRGERSALQRQLNPDAVFAIRTRVWRRAPDYLFLFHNK